MKGILALHRWLPNWLIAAMLIIPAQAGVAAEKPGNPAEAASSGSARIFGRLIDKDRKPVPGITLRLVDYIGDGSVKLNANTMNSTTDAAGKFAFSSVRRGKYAVIEGVQPLRGPTGALIVIDIGEANLKIDLGDIAYKTR